MEDRGAATQHRASGDLAAVTLEAGTVHDLVDVGE